MLWVLLGKGGRSEGSSLQQSAGAYVSCVSRCWWRGVVLQWLGEWLRFGCGQHTVMSDSSERLFYSSQKLREWSTLLTESIWKEEMPTVQSLAAWHSDDSAKSILPSRLNSTPSPVCVEGLTRRPQTDWLVLRGLWSAYIVSTGTALALTTLSWLVDNL